MSTAPGPAAASPAAGDAVLTTVRGRVLVVTLNRPHVRNAIDSAVSRGVLAALARLDGDDELRVGVLHGAGGTFSAGMDLKAFARVGLPEGIDSLFRKGARKPLIAAVEGVALGGGLELALVADLLVAADDATFGSPEVRFGLFPGGGALLKLPRLLPQGLVARLALTGQPLPARQAYHHGMVVELCQPGRTLAVALDLAEAIAANAPLGVAAAKEVLQLGTGLADGSSWAAQRRLVGTVFDSEDAREGARAFAERRDPVWRGR